MNEVKRQNDKRLRDMYGPDNAAFTVSFWKRAVGVIVLAFAFTIVGTILFFTLGIAKLVGIREL